MSKSQSEFPSPKKLCRALHSEEAQPLFEFRHFKVLTFSDHFWMTTWKWLWLCGILAAGSRQWLVMCDVRHQSRKAAAHSMLLQAVCVKYWLLIFTCIYIVACAGYLANIYMETAGSVRPVSTVCPEQLGIMSCVCWWPILSAAVCYPRLLSGKTKLDHRL